jgi:RNA polymerase-binding protein DksA
MSTIDTDHFREMLLAERERVQAAIAYLHQENPGTIEDETGDEAFDNHPADTATVTYDREMDYTLEDNAEAVLAAIEKALQKIENGTYGICERCGKPIDPARLEALPYAELCIEDKRQSLR